MYHCGLNRKTGEVDVFHTRHKPTKETHGDTYNFLFGGYKRRSKATQVANQQYYAKVNQIGMRKPLRQK